MAVNLMGKGYRVIAYDIAKENVQKVCKEGAVAAATPAELARQSDLIISMLPENEGHGPGARGPRRRGGRREGGVHLHRYGHRDPVLFKRLSAELKEKYKINLVDAPVSGGVPKAKTGELSVIVSGPKEVIDGARPGFGVPCREHSHVGRGGGHGPGDQVAQQHAVQLLPGFAVRGSGAGQKVRPFAPYAGGYF
jgi:2-hydroxy-3-oxopropionate reductase